MGFFFPPLTDLSLWLASGVQPGETNIRPNSLIFPSSPCIFFNTWFHFSLGSIRQTRDMEVNESGGAGGLDSDVARCLYIKFQFSMHFCKKTNWGLLDVYICFYRPSLSFVQWSGISHLSRYLSLQFNRNYFEIFTSTSWSNTAPLSWPLSHIQRRYELISSMFLFHHIWGMCATWQHVYLCSGRVQHPQISSSLFNFQCSEMLRRSRLPCNTISFSCAFCFQCWARLYRGALKCDFQCGKICFFFTFRVQGGKKNNDLLPWSVSSEPASVSLTKTPKSPAVTILAFLNDVFLE